MALLSFRAYKHFGFRDFEIRSKPLIVELDL